MNGLLFITLAAFALLALIIIVLIKTTRLRLWQGLVLFLLPLILANLVWFSWVAPHRLQASQHEQAVKQLATMPGFRVLQTQEPALWLLLTQELTRRIRAGEPAEQATGELRGWLIEVINQRLMRGTDQAVVNYIRVSVEEMKALNRLDPGLCFRYLYPQVSGGINLLTTLPPSLNRKEADAMEQLLLNSPPPDQPLDKPLAQADLQNIVGRLYQQWGEKLQQLNMPADTAVDRSSLCAMSIDLYSAILALPDKRAANLLRRMIALTGQ
ncbi:hypothetical protein [Pantoea anthophila]|uniref:hypothetical protein n=1 Tax=Pantoea anthophila TaxID=470931 RepID=UPI000614CCCC|nr:hypothetical protein [Pantoea anthophila]KKB03766.1 hypothetical protein TN98_14695 [Pantoea anthophila]